MRFPPFSSGPPLPPLDGSNPQPPQWFTVWEAMHMKPWEWQRYYDGLMVYLMSQETSWWYAVLNMKTRVAGDTGWGGEFDGGVRTP